MLTNLSYVIFFHCSVRPTVSPMLPASPINMAKFESIMTYNSSQSNSNPNINIAQNSNMCKMIDQNMLSPPQIEIEEFVWSFNTYNFIFLLNFFHST